MSRTRLWLLLLTGLAVRLALAAGAPLANDEAYYWDWGRALQLSYLDHPPGVAWLAAAGGWLATGTLGARLLVPFLHLAGTLLMLKSAALLKDGAGRSPLTGRETLAVLALTELVPVFSLEGVLLLPDAGLLCMLALALYLALLAARGDGGSGGDADERTGGTGGPPRWRLALPFGIALGAAGLFKYHAAPLAVGLAAGLLLTRRGVAARLKTGVFLAAAAAAALAVTAPVWLWNAAHAWASFRFQGSHGMEGLAFDPLAGARVLVGEAVLLTPAVFAGALVLAATGWRGPAAGVLPRAGFWALFAPLTVLAFGKQQLPHWTAPAFWMLVPALGLQLATRLPPRRFASWVNGVTAVLLTVVGPGILATPPLLHGLVRAFGGDPGFLSELTIWEPLAGAAQTDPDLQRAVATLAAQGAAPSCPRPMALASLRWFWTAQLAFHWPDQPRVYSLDFNHLSFYAYRDELSALAGCPVLVLGDRHHLDREQLERAVVLDQELTLAVPDHGATSVVALVGHFRPRDALLALPTPAATFR